MLFLNCNRFLESEVQNIKINDINNHNCMNHSYIFGVNYLKKLLSLNNYQFSNINISTGTDFVYFKRNIDLFFTIYHFLNENKKPLTLKELINNSGYKKNILQDRLVWLIHHNLINVTKPKDNLNSDNILLSISDIGFTFIRQFD